MTPANKATSETKPGPEKASPENKGTEADAGKTAIEIHEIADEAYELLCELTDGARVVRHGKGPVLIRKGVSMGDTDNHEAVDEALVAGLASVGLLSDQADGIFLTGAGRSARDALAAGYSKAEADAAAATVDRAGEKAAADKKAADDKAAKDAADKKAADEKAAADKKAAEEKAAVDKKAADDKAAAKADGGLPLGDTAKKPAA